MARVESGQRSIILIVINLIISAQISTSILYRSFCSCRVVAETGVAVNSGIYHNEAYFGMCQNEELRCGGALLLISENIIYKIWLVY